MYGSPTASPGAGWTRAVRSRHSGFGQRPISGKDWSGRSPGTSRCDAAPRLGAAQQRLQIGVEIVMVHLVFSVERLVHRADPRREVERFAHRPTKPPLELVQGDAADRQGR